MRTDGHSFIELFLGQDVEIVLENVSATNPPPGVTFPNEGILVAVDAYGVVLRRIAKNRPEELVFFPYSTVRCIRRRQPPAGAAVERPASSASRGEATVVAAVRGESTVIAEKPPTFQPPDKTEKAEKAEKAPAPGSIFQPRFRKSGT